jgi:hypothetical protein
MLMKRSTINFIVDLAGFLTLLGLIITASILRWILPPGTGGLGRELHGGRGREHIKQLLGMGRHDWGDIHLWLGVAFVVLMLVHIILHWGWIKCYFKSLFSPSEKPPCE